MFNFFSDHLGEKEKMCLHSVSVIDSTNEETRAMGASIKTNF